MSCSHRINFNFSRYLIGWLPLHVCWTSSRNEFWQVSSRLGILSRNRYWTYLSNRIKFVIINLLFVSTNYTVLDFDRTCSFDLWISSHVEVWITLTFESCWIFISSTQLGTTDWGSERDETRERIHSALIVTKEKYRTNQWLSQGRQDWLQVLGGMNPKPFVDQRWKKHFELRRKS